MATLTWTIGKWGTDVWNNGAGVDVTPPTVPTSLSATVISSTRVDLTWVASTDAVGVTNYRVYRNAVLLATVAAVAAVNYGAAIYGSSVYSAGTSYSDTTASPTTTYSYTVDAGDQAGNHSAQSSPASATTPAGSDITPPTVPSSLIATATNAFRIDLSWAASSDAVGVIGYDIYRGGVLLITVGSTTSYADNSVLPSTTYSYRVAAFDAAGNHSAQSSAASATTPANSDVTAPTVPTGLAATAAGSSNHITLSWNASTDAVGVTGYTIYRGGSPLTTVISPGYDDFGVSPSTLYSYTVDAFDGAGNHSAQSSAASATTAAAAISASGQWRLARVSVSFN